jgi:hypothetical protein
MKRHGNVTSDLFAAAAAPAAPPRAPGSGAGRSSRASDCTKQPAALALRGIKDNREDLGSARPRVLPGAMRVVSALDTIKCQQTEGGGSTNVGGSDDDGRCDEIGLSDMAFHFEYELNVPMCMISPHEINPATPCVRFTTFFSAPRLKSF